VNGRAALGAIVTILGVIFLIYGIAYGAANKKIGTYATVKFDNATKTLKVEGKPAGLDRESATLILGWFLILVGPAIWVGEVPATIKGRVGGGAQ